MSFGSKIFKLRKEQNLFFPSVFAKREVLKNNQPIFDIQYTLASDYKFLLKSFIDGWKFYYLDKNLAYYRLGGSTTQQIKKSWKEVKDIQIEFGKNRLLAELYYYEKVVKRILLKALGRL